MLRTHQSSPERSPEADEPRVSPSRTSHLGHKRCPRNRQRCQSHSRHRSPRTRSRRLERHIAECWCAMSERRFKNSGTTWRSGVAVPENWELHLRTPGARYRIPSRRFNLGGSSRMRTALKLVNIGDALSAPLEYSAPLKKCVRIKALYGTSENSAKAEFGSTLGLNDGGHGHELLCGCT